mmetsp:Transcript_24845/g.38403  ORF Transcript_24845/g.38403 Transcript_24845/m.38403 type:complete len:108 (-) Transcript_24845:1259-1582(-)
MGILIPKRQRQTHQLPLRIQGPESQEPRAGTNYFRSMFPAEPTAGGVPLPGSYHAQGFTAPYDITGPAENTQMLEHPIAATSTSGHTTLSKNRWRVLNAEIDLGLHK